MPQRSPHAAALDFLQEWEEGNTPVLADYLACCTGDDREMLEIVADCVILEGLAFPADMKMMACPA